MFFRLGLLVFLYCFSGFVSPLRAVDASSENKVIEMSRLIFSHTSDAHSFHFFDYRGHSFGMALPVILYQPDRGWRMFSSARFGHGDQDYDGYRMVGEKIIAVRNGIVLNDTKVYDFSLTRNVVQLFIACLLLVFLARKTYVYYRNEATQRAPRGVSAWLEPVVLFVYKEVIVSNFKPEKTKKYAPFLLTLFFFILINNLLGLIPGSANVTGNIAFTLVLACFSFLYILFSSRRAYWRHIIWPSGPVLIKIILIPIEIIGVFTKPFALMIRLFANMLAGHISIICFISLIFVFTLLHKAIGISFIPFSLAFTVFVYFLELLVATLQAFIFVSLTATFIAQTMEEH